MNSIVSKLKDERLLLFFAYFFGTLNFFIGKYVNIALLSNQNEVLVMWMPAMHLFAIIGAVFTLSAFLFFIFRKAPKFKWVGYALLIITLSSNIFMMTNTSFFGNFYWQSAIYVTISSLHAILNFIIAYLIVSHQFCIKQSHNIVIAMKLISTSLLLTLPYIGYLPNARIVQGLSSMLLNVDSILRFAVIVVLLLSLLIKTDEVSFQ